MGIDSNLRTSNDLLLINLQQVKGDVVGIGVNCVGEEFDFERDPSHFNELQTQSESLSHDENLDDLVIIDKFLVVL